ncbi:MAG: hypothetical protein ACRETO_11425 [Gammaproteobacteria bacterium]
MYTKFAIPNLNAGEQGYQLDSGEYIAAQAIVTRDTVHHLLSCVVKARLVDGEGTPVKDGNGEAVSTAHTYAIPPAYLADVGGVAGLVKQTLDIVLGEPDAIAEADDNIRHAITATTAAAPFDLSTLG